MDKNLTIKDKIFAFLEHKGIKKVDFFEKTGIQSSNFKGKNKSSQLGGDMIVKVLTTYPDLSADWLLTGRGEMIKRSERDGELATATNDPTEGIPLIPASAMAGALSGEISVMEYECERYVVPAFSGADFLIRVKGDSMMPTYVSGDIVACQRISMNGIFFQWNRPYVIDTAQGVVIKRLKPGSDKRHILIVSDNTNYDPFELPISQIYHVALVIGLIRLE